jgi:hypothetical protein
MDSVSVFSWLMSRWRIGALLASGLAVTCVYKISTENKKQRAQKAKLKRERKLSRVAKQISKYAGDLRKQYPTGEVVISDSDLAQQLRKPQELVSSALTLLADQKQVQRAPLAGYWKLNM